MNEIIYRYISIPWNIEKCTLLFSCNNNKVHITIFQFRLINHDWIMIPFPAQTHDKILIWLWLMKKRPPWPFPQKKCRFKEGYLWHFPSIYCRKVMRKLFYFNKNFSFCPWQPNSNIFHRSYLGKRPESKTIKVSQKPFYYYSCQGYRYKDTKLWQLVVTWLESWHTVQKIT